jgi:hypothetical protein
MVLYYMVPQDFITYGLIGITTIVLAVVTILEESPEEPEPEPEEKFPTSTGGKRKTKKRKITK